jgi:hypothetical protein
MTPLLTSEHAAMLYDLAQEHRTVIIQRWSPGFVQGVLLALAQIDRGGGAMLLEQPLDYGRNIVAAAIIPAKTYVAWPGAATVPEPFEPVGMLPHLTYQALLWRPVSLSRTKTPLAIFPLPPVIAVPPPLPLK